MIHPRLDHERSATLANPGVEWGGVIVPPGKVPVEALIREVMDRVRADTLSRPPSALHPPRVRPPAPQPPPVVRVPSAPRVPVADHAAQEASIRAMLGLLAEEKAQAEPVPLVGQAIVTELLKAPAEIHQYAYRLPGFFMTYGPVEATDEAEAREKIRVLLDLKRLPKGLDLWDLADKPMPKWKIVDTDAMAG